MSQAPPQALAGIRVLDLADGIAGPYCAKLLGDYGADVLKVEPPQGDSSRRLGPFPNDDPHPDRSGMYLFLNTNKRGVTLDVRTVSGRSLMERLLAWSDIVIESFAPRDAEQLGLTHERMQQIKPGLVLISITCFGRTGPYANDPGDELSVQAMGTVMFSSGSPDREPLALPFPIAEYYSAISAATAAMASLMFKATTGLGEHVDCAWLDSMVSLQELALGDALRNGNLRRRTGHRRSFNHPMCIYPCKDGYVSVSAPTAQEWRAVTHLIERPELETDPRFDAPLNRVANADELDVILEGWLLEHTSQQIFDRSRELHLSVGVVNNPKQLLNWEHLNTRNFFQETAIPGTDKMLPIPGAPFVMSETPWSLRRHAPTLGQNNKEVYGDMLGVSPDELLALVQANVV